MRSEMRLCRFLTAFHAWEPPVTRIQNCANAIWPKSCTAGPGRPVFSSVFVRLFTAHCPASFFRAGIAILARKVTLEFCAILEMTQTARDLLLARPAGRVLGDRRRLSCPHCFLCHTKTRLVRVQRVDRGRTDSNAPSSRAQWRRHPACLVERCTGLAPQIPPGPCPTSIE